MNAWHGGGGIMRRILAVLGLAGLAACGGGGGGGNDVTLDAPATGSHTQQLRALNSTAERLADQDFTPDLPTSGSATYTGHLAGLAVFGTAEPVLVTAGVTLTAEFVPGTIAGSFTNARSADDAVSGSGTFTDGAIGPAGIDTRVTGTLSRAGTVHAVDGAFRGAFLGANARAIVGGIEADLRRDGTAAGNFQAEVWAED
jgi:hypothetical protein